MTAQRQQMINRFMEVVHNTISNPHHLQFLAKISANVSFGDTPVYPGRVMHLNASGELETGLPTGAKKLNMPLWVWGASNDPDASNYGGDPATDGEVWVSGRPRGFIKCLPATGGYEMEVVEFESEESLGSTYLPGHGLTAIHANSNAVTGGRMTKGVAYEDPICGIVSRGVGTRFHNKPTLAFWSYFLPQYEA